MDQWIRFNLKISEFHVFIRHEYIFFIWTYCDCFVKLDQSFHERKWITFPTNSCLLFGFVNNQASPSCLYDIKCNFYYCLIYFYCMVAFYHSNNIIGSKRNILNRQHLIQAVDSTYKFSLCKTHQIFTTFPSRRGLEYTFIAAG